MAVTCDDAGNAYITGNTTSTNNIATSGVYQTTYGGGGSLGDGFVAKFDSSGQRIWGTYFGGSADDGANGIAYSSGHIYISGRAMSTSSIASTGAYHTVRDTLDGFLAKFDTSGHRLWSTYYGWGFSVACDASDNVFVAGRTISPDYIATAGALQTVKIGNTGPTGSQTNAFLAKFNGSGTLQWGTYVGDTASCVARSLAYDGGTKLVIGGYIYAGHSNIATPGTYQDTDGGPGINAFVAEFNTSGTRLWGSYFGGFNVTEGNSVAFDKAGSFLLAGFSNDSDMATPGSFQSVVSNLGADAILVKFHDSICSPPTAYITSDPPTYISGSTMTFTSHLSDTSGISYQWEKNGLPIPGATFSSYTTSNINANDTICVIIYSDKPCAVPGSSVACLGLTTNTYAINNSLGRIILYPSPLSSVLHIDASEPMNVNITSVEGKILIHQDHAINIDVSSLADGIYIVQVYNEHGILMKVQKMVKE